MEEDRKQTLSLQVNFKKESEQSRATRGEKLGLWAG
jgi:hypothetical protein